MLAMFGDLTPVEMLLRPVSTAIQNSVWWLLFFIAFVVAGIFVQIRSNQQFEIESYNRMDSDF